MKRIFWNRGEGRLRALWRLAGQQLIQWLLVWLPLSALSTLAALLGLGLGHGPRGGFALVAYGVCTALASVGSVWLAARALDHRPLADFGFSLGRRWWRDLGFGALLGALLMSGIFTAEYAEGWLSVIGLFRGGGALGFAAALPAALVVFLCVAISEELAFRGYLLTNLAQGLNGPAGGPRAALLLSTLISSAWFGLAHVRNPNATLLSTLNVAAAGGLLALGYVLTGRLGLPIGLHLTWNLFQGNIFGFPVSGLTGFGPTLLCIRQDGPGLWTGGDFGPEAGLLGLLAMLAGGVLIVLWLRACDGEIALCAPLTAPPATLTARDGSPLPAPYAGGAASAGSPPDSA